MKKHFIFISICLALAITFNMAQVCFGADKSSVSNSESTTAQQEDRYEIGSGDIIDVVTWKEPDFSREQILVRVDGKITLPLLNDLQAAGLTPIELKKDIERRLKGFVANPEVTVTIRTPNSQKFYILGEVVNTGEYPLVKNLTVLQAFAIAGGFTEWASKKEIILLRRKDGKEKIHRINYKSIIKGKEFSKNNLPLKANDTIIVP